MTLEATEPVKNAIDVAAGATALGTWLGYAPEWAAVATLLWTGIRVFEWAERRFFRKSGSPTTKE
jgi:hypothetical protein